MTGDVIMEVPVIINMADHFPKTSALRFSVIDQRTN